MPQIQKTIKLPISNEITKKKLNYIENISSRYTFAVSLFLNKIIENNITSTKEAQQFYYEIKERTGLNAGYTQSARDRAVQMYRSYITLHKKWEKQLLKVKEQSEKHPRSKKLQRKLHRTKQKEPQLPTVKRKQPILFDTRTGRLEQSKEATKFTMWANISTLKKNQTISIPLHTYAYAIKHLTNEWSFQSFKLIRNYRLNRWEFHITVKKESTPEIKHIAGVDLGIKRPAVITAIGENNRVILYEKTEKHKPTFQKIHELNNRIAKLQRLGKTRAVKKLRHKRDNILNDTRHKMAKELADELPDTYVFIGYPYNIRSEHYRGNGHKKTRAMVNRWAFKDFGSILELKVNENNGNAEWLNEYWTTKQCPSCQSKNVSINDRHFHCNDCGLSSDRDVVGSINILLKGLNLCHVKRKQRMVGAVVTEPEVWMKELKKLLNTQPTTQGVSI